MGLKLGCIADDFTGATDLANNLVRAGMRVVQTIGVSPSPLPDHCDAVVIALKTRTIAPAEAVAQSVAALQWLQSQGVEQVYFKYCSTFDSWYEGEVRGNIGPVTEALMDAMGCDFTIATPAFPDNQRTVFKGHLFVGDLLLSDSGMRNHPLTPMRDANLVRVLQAQCQRKVGLVDFQTVALGALAAAPSFWVGRKRLSRPIRPPDCASMLNLPMRVNCMTGGADITQTMASQAILRACKASSTGRKWSSMNSMVTMTRSAWPMSSRQACNDCSSSRQEEAE